jgi:lysophospholipase L1-like esterase
MNQLSQLPPSPAPRPAWNTAAAQATAGQVPVPLWAYGDSWLYGDILFLPELVSELPAFGYSVVDASFADTGSTLAMLAGRAEDFSLKLAVARAAGEQPKAILLGGGGNDLVRAPNGLTNRPTETPLFAMLDPSPTAAERATADFIEGTLAGLYRNILDAILQATPAAGGAPVFIHGYDHPIPDGRRIQVLTVKIGPWLQPVFAARGLHDVAANRQRMRELIDRLNRMVQGLTQEAAYRGRVWHLKLTGVLATDELDPHAHERLWHDELHPHAEGYRMLAQEMANQLKAAGIV